MSQFRASGVPIRWRPAPDPIPVDRPIHALADRRWIDPNVVDPDGRYNVYDCQACGVALLSVDLDRGVTPMFVGCPDCSGTAASRCYSVKDPAAHLPIRMVWRLATRGERKRERREGGDHFERGGLAREWVKAAAS